MFQDSYKTVKILLHYYCKNVTAVNNGHPLTTPAIGQLMK